MISDTNTDDFFTPKHARLTNLAAAANILAWIVLVLWTLYVGVRLYGQIMIRISAYGSISSPLALFDPLTEIVSYSKLFLQGVIYWLVLRGVSLGLNMIVETDLNYREKSQGVSHVR